MTFLQSLFSAQGRVSRKDKTMTTQTLSERRCQIGVYDWLVISREMMTIMRTIASVIVLFLFAVPAALALLAPAFAQEGCAWGDRVPGYPPGVVWQFLVQPDIAFAEGTGITHSDTIDSAQIQFRLERNNESARKGKLYRVAMALNYKQFGPRPRSLKAMLTVGTSKSEFAVQEAPYTGGGSSRGRVDLSPLAPDLLNAIRGGRDATVTIYDGDKEYLGQAYGSWLQPKFELMESKMESIFGLTDANKCKLPAEPPYQRLGPFL